LLLAVNRTVLPSSETSVARKLRPVNLSSDLPAPSPPDGTIARPSLTRQMRPRSSADHTAPDPSRSGVLRLVRPSRIHRRLSGLVTARVPSCESLIVQYRPAEPSSPVARP